jgi:hypothetical protein
MSLLSTNVSYLGLDLLTDEDRWKCQKHKMQIFHAHPCTVRVDQILVDGMKLFSKDSVKLFKKGKHARNA